MSQFKEFSSWECSSHIYHINATCSPSLKYSLTWRTQTMCWLKAVINKPFNPWISASKIVIAPTQSAVSPGLARPLRVYKKYVVSLSAHIRKTQKYVWWNLAQTTCVSQSLHNAHILTYFPQLLNRITARCRLTTPHANMIILWFFKKFCPHLKFNISNLFPKVVLPYFSRNSFLASPVCLWDHDLKLYIWSIAGYYISINCLSLG